MIGGARRPSRSTSAPRPGSSPRKLSQSPPATRASSRATSVENAIQYFLDVSDRRRARERLAPFRVERLDYRNQDRAAFFQGLERNGTKAVQEFRDAFDE